ncbi:hypothetical protein M2189_005435 [Bradyrhizobium japonicum]|uniref:UGSC family (seleno)protein n=1 Tax=Bradyrhizobium japonicum TaxID=375 RepID=UPI002167759A|nr:hypothetical protein [Bradyrhizobium japonicum]MCS3495606.1 hypothetical protein [Bradyrhizobium japonicum]MCS3962232.1 hypothetical protein [Bradyrhizobium japonicum]MCS3994549.1 hypothetical protein [Bradyrhizobium japonicum]
MLMKVTAANSLTVFDPRGVVESANTPIAARPKSLDGLRLAILDNSKWNANKILRTSMAALEKTIKFAKVNYYVKGSFSKDAKPELIAEIAANNDLVLTAIGDCGSCCFCCIRDSVTLEKLGLPSAAIITTEFEKRNRADSDRDRHGGIDSGCHRPPRQQHHSGRDRRPRSHGSRESS